MRHSTRITVGLAGFALVFLSACSEPGPAEQAGESIDEAVENVRDTLDPAGPAERAGRDVDEAVDNVSGD